jgi:IS30 family transposase
MAHSAEDLAQLRRSLASRSRERLKSEQIRKYVESKLKTEWSPELIAGRLGIEHPGLSISYEAIYQWILLDRPELRSYLIACGRSKRRRRCGKKQRFKAPAAPKTSIELRPPAANNMETIGHFELDAIKGVISSTTALSNTIDRRSRRLFLHKVPNLEAKPYREKFVARMKQEVPSKHLLTLTNDNGSEHAEHDKIEQELGIKVYFSHAYCSCERGTVENRNRAIRRFFPKGTNFDDIPDDFIEWTENYLNNKPMKVLGFLTPMEVWNAEVEGKPVTF